MPATLTGLYFSVFGTLMLTVWEALDGAGQGIIVTAAACAAVGWLYAKVVKPVVVVLIRTYHAVDVLEDLPDFMAETRARLDNAERRMILPERRGVGDSPAHEPNDSPS